MTFSAARVFREEDGAAGVASGTEAELTQQTLGAAQEGDNGEEALCAAICEALEMKEAAAVKSPSKSLLEVLLKVRASERLLLSALCDSGTAECLPSASAAR